MDKLADLYYDPSNPASYSSARRLYMEAKQRGFRVTERNVKQWLQQQRVYTTHKRVRLKFPRTKIRVFGIDELWEADLGDMAKLSRQNGGFRYLLTVVDVFSKQAFVVPKKQKGPYR